MSESQAEDERSSTATIHAWVEYYLPRGLAYARSLLRDSHAAEDVVHDCFCRLLAKRDVYDLPKDGFKPLLRSITNACINLGRKDTPVSNSLDLTGRAMSPVEKYRTIGSCSRHMLRCTARLHISILSRFHSWSMRQTADESKYHRKATWGAI